MSEPKLRILSYESSHVPPGPGGKFAIFLSVGNLGVIALRIVLCENIRTHIVQSANIVICIISQMRGFALRIFMCKSSHLASFTSLCAKLPISRIHTVDIRMPRVDIRLPRVSGL